LIVLDMQMPVMGGAETLQEVLAMKPDMRVILTSGYSDWDQIESATLRPSVVFLQKPYPVDTLINTVREQLRHLESRQPVQRSPM
jgi:DNA-binding NtrC family response regulator